MPIDPSTIAGLALWLDGRTTSVFADTAGASLISAPNGRVRRIDSPSALSGAQWLATSDSVRPFRDLNALTFETGPQQLAIAAPAGVTLPIAGATLAGSFLNLGNGSYNSALLIGSDGGVFGPLITNRFGCYHGSVFWDSGVVTPIGSRVAWVLNITGAGLALKISVDGVVSTASLVSALPGTTISALIAGGGTGWNCSCVQSQILGYSASISNTDRDNLLAFLQATVPSLPLDAPIIGVSGDSIGAGFGVAATASWSALALANTWTNAAPARLCNASVAGYTIVDLVGIYPTALQPLVRAAGRTQPFVVIVEGMTNSMPDSVGLTAAQVLAQLYAHCDTIRADGGKVALWTCLPRQDAAAGPGFPAKRAAVNSDIRANWASHADALIDTTTISGMSLDSDANGANFQADHLHINAAGAALIAALTNTQIAPLLSPPAPPPPAPGPFTRPRIIPLPGGTEIDTGGDPTIVTADDGNITLHTPLALSRLIERWRAENHPNLANLLVSYTDQLQLIENTLWEVLIQRLPDYAGTAQLDVLGRIVGEPRQGQSNAQFRARLKVRIRINQSFGTATDVIEVLQMLDPATFVYIERSGVGFDVVYLTRPTSPAIAAQIPRLVSQTRAAGVGATVTIPADSVRGARFGTKRNGSTNQHIGFGTTRNTTTGGLFAHIAKA